MDNSSFFDLLGADDLKSFGFQLVSKINKVIMKSDFRHVVCLSPSLSVSSHINLNLIFEKSSLKNQVGQT